MGSLGLRGSEYGSQDTPNPPPPPTLRLGAWGSSSMNGLISEAKIEITLALWTRSKLGLASPLQLSGSFRACQLDEASLSPVPKGEG